MVPLLGKWPGGLPMKLGSIDGPLTPALSPSEGERGNHPQRVDAGEVHGQGFRLQGDAALFGDQEADLPGLWPKPGGQLLQFEPERSQVQAEAEVER